MCYGVETAQPGDRTTDPGIVMPERYESSQRIHSLARDVITPVRHTHTRLHVHMTGLHVRFLVCLCYFKMTSYPRGLLSVLRITTF